MITVLLTEYCQLRYHLSKINRSDTENHYCVSAAETAETLLCSSCSTSGLNCLKNNPNACRYQGTGAKENWLTSSEININYGYIQWSLQAEVLSHWKDLLFINFLGIFTVKHCRVVQFTFRSAWDTETDEMYR